MSKKGKTNTILISILAAGFILRLFLAYFYPPYPEAMLQWAERIIETGFADFYGPEVQWPYPPLYLYVLWIVGGIIKLFGISDPAMKELVTELPAILCDMGAVLLLWHAVKGRLSEKTGLIICALYAFNPAVIHNSSMWGQTDAVFTLAVALMCVSLCEKKLPAAFIFFGAGLMLKQQTLTFAPVLLAAMAEQIFFKDFSVKRSLKLFAEGLAVIAGMLLISIPFGLKEMLSQYLSVQSGMPWVSVGAYNFWCLAGRSWAPLDTTFAGIACSTWGKLAIAGITLLSFILAYLYREDEKKYPLLGAALILPVFCFATGMHERYMLSGLLLLALACVYDPVKPLMVFYLIFSALQLCNTVAVYDYALHETPLISAIPQQTVEKLLSLGVVLTTLCFIAYLLFSAVRKDKTVKGDQQEDPVGIHGMS